MQHLKMSYVIVDCNLDFMFTKEIEHWEAFPIGNNQSEPAFPKNGGQYHDLYSDQSGKTRQCTFGLIEFKATSKFFDFPVPIPPFKIGGCSTAGVDQPCTTDDPSKVDKRLVMPQDSGKHNVRVAWDCCCPCCDYYRDWIGWPF